MTLRESDVDLENPPLSPELSAVASRRVCEGVLDAVGGTPLVHLRRYLPSATFQLYAKLESLNPGGSIKDRPAKQILEHALSTGILHPGGVVVESSSGNMGIGLAQVCRYHSLRFICVVDSKTTEANRRVLRAYGAEIDLVSEPDPETGELLQARLARVQELIRTIPGAFWPNQYANRKNSASHYHTTMHEVTTALWGEVDFVFIPTSTCGTLRGCSEYVRDRGMKTQIVAVDACGSMIFSDVRAPRMVPGLGAGLRPPLYEPSLFHQCVHVSDLDCVNGCRRLMDREAILAGGSSGGVLSAIERLAERIPASSVVVGLLPDRGERYLDTVFSDDWVASHFGEGAPFRGGPVTQP